MMNRFDYLRLRVHGESCRRAPRDSVSPRTFDMTRTLPRPWYSAVVINSRIRNTPRPLPLLRVFYGKYPLEEVEAEGELKVTGDRDLARRFVELFSLPEKVG